MKARVELIDPEFILALGRVLTVGAAKYGDRSFHEGMDWNERIGSLQRHVLAFQNRQDIDDETQECHLINAAANCMMLYHNWLRGRGKDTR